MEKVTVSAVNDSALESLPIAVRAFALEPKKKLTKKRWQGKPMPPSKWYLIFDTETSTDAVQQLRIGAYQVRKSGKIHEEGFFYDPQSLTQEEMTTLQNFADSHDKVVRTVKEFIEEVFFSVLHELGGTCIGFNLPFDFSRLAVSHTLARKKMRGGFSFSLTENSHCPRIQVKHLNSKASMIQLTIPQGRSPEQRNREKGRNVYHRRGYIIDVKALSSALLGNSHSLASLARFLKTLHQKLETEEHGNKLTQQYLEYALQDVQVTWECFEILQAQYEKLNLTQTLISRILSEASLGKAYLSEMGIKPWLEQENIFPKELIGIIMSTYHGGRAEVNLRREIARVLYCDFISMYPTICILMGLWKFVIAQKVEYEETTEEVQHFLEHITIQDFQKQETWQKLCSIVQVSPEEDFFPVRSSYGRNSTLTMALNYLTSSNPPWFTLADCMVSKMVTGKTPKILKAISFHPSGCQEELHSIFLAGNPSYPINPKEDDFYKRLIDLRTEIKMKKNKAKEAGDTELASKLDAEQNNLKIIANATSYGIFLELNVTKYEKPRKVICYGSEGKGFPIRVQNIEEPGRYFYPILSTCITGGARLMLALAQQLCEEKDLTWVFCDTDSLAITPKQEMNFKEFIRKVEEVREWFTPLNPYAQKESLLKLEEVNYNIRDGISTDTLEPLYAFAVSSKRYGLFNIDIKGNPVIRKASAHGLGHLIPPYEENEAPDTIPKPQIPLSEIGVERWQYDLWYRIIEAALKRHPNKVKLYDLPGFNKLAASRYAATTPALLSWFSKYNEGKPYREQVRPFSFLYSFFLDKKRLHSVEVIHEKEALEKEKEGSETLDDFPRPAAPFNEDLEAAAKHCFDRNTGKPIPLSFLKTYRDVLAQYHLRPEDKFLNGDYRDSGFTERRHIMTTTIEHIGKEANRWEDQLYTGENLEEQVLYGTNSEISKNTLQDEVSKRALARESHVSRNKILRFHKGEKVTQRTAAKIYQGHSSLATQKKEEAEYIQDLLSRIKAYCQVNRLRQFAKDAGVAPSNLSNILRGKRKISLSLLAKLEKTLRELKEEY